MLPHFTSLSWTTEKLQVVLLEGKTCFFSLVSVYNRKTREQPRVVGRKKPVRPMSPAVTPFLQTHRPLSHRGSRVIPPEHKRRLYLVIQWLTDWLTVFVWPLLPLLSLLWAFICLITTKWPNKRSAAWSRFLTPRWSLSHSWLPQY